MSEKKLPNYEYSDLLKRNICPICAKMDCPFLTESKYGKEMMKAYRSGDFGRAKKIYIQRCAQFHGMMMFHLDKAIKTYDDIVSVLTSPATAPFPNKLTTATQAAWNNLKLGTTIQASTAAPIAIVTPSLPITTSSSAGAVESLSTILGRSLGLGLDLMLYSKPAGKGSDFYPNTIYRPVDINARPTPEAQILNIPERNILNDIAKRAGTIKTTAIFVETSVNGAKQIDLIKTEKPVQTRVIEAHKTVEAGVFSFTPGKDKQEHKVLIGTSAILKGTPLSEPERHKYIPGKIYDIPRFDDLPLEMAKFFTQEEKGIYTNKEPLILVFPQATGISPIYLSAGKKDKIRQGVKEKGHDYHPAPKTEEIKGFGELKEGKWKTPKQGGGGKRKRWFGDKGRKIYEWDYQHGEIEGYRASDGQHIGVFDPKTGNQIKPADPKRNIKKYL